MTERPLLSPLPFEIGDRQRRAADPQHSVWVEANAGSGKTRVLTDRVLRLLLAGSRPEEILCLTYTKAAAAEMRERIAGRLAQWALSDDAALRTSLFELSGAHPDERLLGRARTLFVHALEAPGGLKIQTIHAFCESLLHRFPVEAGIPFDFTVLEDHERAAMVLDARETVLAGALRPDATLGVAVETLFAEMTDSGIAEAIDDALARPRALAAVLRDRAGAKRRLRHLVGAPAGETTLSLAAEITDRYPFDAGDHQAILAAFPPKAGGSRFEDKLAGLDPSSAPSLLATYLTQDGAVPKAFPKKDMVSRFPALADALLAEANRLADCAERLRRAELIARSEALVDVLGAIADGYEARKRARSLLDFDDLVDRVGQLLANPAEGAWVRYKLDGRISHILVDESQDTNREQWAVVEALAGEFFAGEGAVDRPRSIFAVGDGKQSIYSFQGADPALFLAAGRHYQRLADAVDRPFRRVPLHTSFRTLPGILTAVDRVFADPDLRAAVLSEDAVQHATARRDAGGSVTLWPPIQEVEEPTDSENWPIAPVESGPGAVRQVARRIARSIAGWVRQGRALGARGRPIRPDDVLILVQSRSALFHEIIRALHRERLTTPGADRLEVTRHIAVLDLLALADVLLNPADDLQLAALLRSPLYDLDEDRLLALANGREGSLWSALEASSDPNCQAAFAELHGWRGRLDFERPYNFYAEVLGPAGGLRRFHTRFGREVDDVFAEFLELALSHEQHQQPSLQGFVVALRQRDVTIRRELSERGTGVRVMTVHGAKGLEAPIVILADAASKPEPSQLGRSLYLAEAVDGPFLVHAASRKAHLAQTLPLLDAEIERQKAEYWRKLYVAMTRAEDELYVTGTLTRTGKLEGSWYASIREALAAHGEIERDADGAEIAFHAPARPADTRLDRIAAPPEAPAAEPVHLDAVPPPPAPTILQPSRLAPPDDPLRLLDATAAQLVDAEAARRAGLAVHALLQHLPKVPPADRPQVAERALSVLWPEGGARHAEIAGKALSILQRPEFAPLFGPDSRGEVPFSAGGLRNGRPVTLSGRIDRLLVTGDTVLIVDFKSDAQPAASLAEVPQAYLIQLALYAQVAGQVFAPRHVKAAILWTGLESLLELPGAALAEAAREFTIG